MNSINAYEIIALHAIAQAGNKDWDTLVSDVVINRRWVSFNSYLEVANAPIAPQQQAPFPLLMRAQHAALFLRDEWCAATGEVIWGFTFRYYSNDNFTIDYRYERPDWVCPLAEGENIQGDAGVQPIHTLSSTPWVS